jgi:cell division protein ZapA
VSEPNSEAVEMTSVTIFGRSYDLRGNEDPGYLAELASVVDEKMREVADATGTSDTQKVAILAALNIADEWLQADRGGSARPKAGVDRRVARMVTLLDEALVE